MAEGQVELTKRTRHPEQVKSYVEKGAPQQLARDLVAKEIRIERLRQEKKEAVDASLTDALTGLPNRRYLDEAKDRMFAETKRMEHGMTALFIDGDNFKEVNLIYGEPVGDLVIKELAKVLKGALREGDFLARFGGEEFVALLPESHELSNQELENLYSRINNKVDTAKFPHNVHQTVSIGIASFSSGDNIDSADELIRRANDAEHQAKISGKNTYVVWDESLPRRTELKGANIPR